MTGGLSQQSRIDAAVMAEVTRDPFAGFDEALAKLVEWDRECRELTKRHLAELAQARAELADLTRDRAEGDRMVAQYEQENSNA